MTNEKPPINWQTTLFLVFSFLIAAIGAPIYIVKIGISLFDIAHFVIMGYATGLSITIGYHRLYAHRAFDGAWPVRFLTMFFGAAAFESSVWNWASDHRYHHKFADHHGYPYDPYSVTKSLFHAHVGWLLRYRVPPLARSNVVDLERDPLVGWQHRNIMALSLGAGLMLPTLIGMLWASFQGTALLHGALGGFLIGGCLRIVVIQHLTFLINSLSHYLGGRPYDGTQTARDNGLLAFFTFGEGYHNFHHVFLTDYRNGIKAWHWDPGKWVIWLLEKVGLASRLQRTPAEAVLFVKIKERKRRLEKRLAAASVSLSEPLAANLARLEAGLEEGQRQIRRLYAKYFQLKADGRPRHELKRLRGELATRREAFRAAARNWSAVHRQALGQLRAAAVLPAA